MLKIYLFYPSKELGGAEMLFARIADHFQDQGLDITILDSDKKCIVSNVINTNIKREIITKGEPIYLSEGILITFGSLFADLPLWVDNSSPIKLCFWCVHPFNLFFLANTQFSNNFHLKYPRIFRFVELLLFRNIYLNRKNQLSYLSTHEGITFMDEENFIWPNRHYRLKMERKFLPVPIVIESFNPIAIRNKLVNDKISIYWVGRVVDFKYFSLKYLINEINKSSFKNEIQLKIVGDGPFLNNIEDDLKMTSFDYSMLGNVCNSDLQKYLLNEASLVVAMGTAALEGANCSVPTILIDPLNDKTIKTYKLKWLFETVNYNLGSYENAKSNKGNTFDDKIIELKSNGFEIAKKNHQYSSMYHSMNQVSEKLLRYAMNSKVDYISYSKINKNQSLLYKLIQWLKKTSFK